MVIVAVTILYHRSWRTRRRWFVDGGREGRI